MSKLVRDQLDLLIRAANVRRFHTVPVHLHQTVGQHSWGVAMLVTLLEPGASAALLRAALLHDVPEAYMGDIPAPVKHGHPAIDEACREMERTVYANLRVEMPTLTEAEARTLKLADCLDGMMTCVAERRMGNRYVDDVYWNFRQYVNDMAPVGREKVIVDHLVEMWMEVTV